MRAILCSLAFFATTSLPAAETPPPVFSIDTVMKALETTHPQATRVPDALPAHVIAEEGLCYAEPDGHRLELDLYRPDDNAVHPLILMVHGGGWIAGDRTMERPLVKQFAARGYVAATVSYRLGQPGRFPAPIHDLKQAIRWLRAHAQAHHIDATRVAIAGGSAGGTLAVTVGVTNGREDFEGPHEPGAPTSDVQAVIDIDGSVSFLDNALIKKSITEQSPYWEYVHGPYPGNEKTWLAASPLFLVSQSCPPVLFLKSTATRPILAGREEMAFRLRMLGVDTDEIQYPDTPHPFWLVQPWFSLVLEDTDRFLKKHHF